MSFSNVNDAANMPPLPAGFQPGEHDVVIGKGKKFYFHSGNQWLRTLVASMLGDYKQAVTKSDKSNIISEVVEYVRSNGRFVKKELKTGQWVYAEPLLCREKCSQTFRDNLAETYRSSNVAKRNKRRQEQSDKKRGASTTAVGGLPSLTNNASDMEMPAAKRMRQMSMTGTAQAASGIPANLFDLDMPLWSPKGQNNGPAVLPSLPNNFDFSSLMAGRRASMTGASNAFQQQHQQAATMNQFGGLNMQMQQNMPSLGDNAMAGLNGAGNHNGSSNDNWSNLLSSLAQTLNGNNNGMAAAAPAAHHQEPTATFNPFEPTPMQDANSIFGALESVLQQANANNQGQAAARAPKRHSLAPLMGDDWFKFNGASAGNTANHGNDQQDAQNISTAFAA